jgi:hypothetical protein
VSPIPFILSGYVPGKSGYRQLGLTFPKNVVSGEARFCGPVPRWTSARQVWRDEEGLMEQGTADWLALSISLVAAIMLIRRIDFSGYATAAGWWAISASGSSCRAIGAIIACFASFILYLLWSLAFAHDNNHNQRLFIADLK